MKRLATLFGILIVAFSPGIASGVTTKTALLVGGKGGYAELEEEEMVTAFGGYFAGYDDRISVEFPGSNDFAHSVRVGTTSLYNAVYETPGFKTIGGVSEGAPAVDRVLRMLLDDMENPKPGKVAPPPHELNVAVYGYPERLYFIGLPYRPFPDTPYDVMIVAAEYDGIADLPDNLFNLLAVVNALMGAAERHVDSAYYDILNDPTYYTISAPSSRGGVTTTVLIPADHLPLLTPLRDAGFAPEFVNFLESLLRPIIDSAYNRPPMKLGILSEEPGIVLPPPAPPAPPAPAGTETLAITSQRVADDGINGSAFAPTAQTTTTTSESRQMTLSEEAGGERIESLPQAGVDDSGGETDGGETNGGAIDGEEAIEGEDAIDQNETVTDDPVVRDDDDEIDGDADEGAGEDQDGAGADADGEGADHESENNDPGNDDAGAAE